MTQAQALVEDRLLRAFPPKGYDVASAAGVWLTASDGRRIMDLGGASHGTALIGHGHPRVVQAIREAAGRTIHVVGNVPTAERTRMLAALHAQLPARLSHTFLANSGTEAVECAIKLAIAGGRDEIVALDGGFHGRTLGALGITSRPAFRGPFASRLAPTRFVRPGDIDALDAAIGPRTAAVIVEPIQGEGGVHEVPHAFLHAASQLAAERGALLVADEVQTGLGRTGAFLAMQHAGVAPDIVTLGKGLAGGLPIGACSVTEEVARMLPPGGHGTTYGGGPLVCAAAEAALEVVRGLIDRAPAIEAGFRAGLEHPAVEHVRGRGAMLAVELRKRAPPALEALEAAGVAALPAGPRAIRILPPLSMSDEEIDEACRRMRQALA